MDCCFCWWFLLPFYAFQGLALVILPKEIQGIHLVSWFPGVVTFRVTLPLYEVLEDSGTSVMSVISNLFYLVLFFIINQVRWGMGVVWTVGICFDVLGKEGCMENWMNCP